MVGGGGGGGGGGGNSMSPMGGGGGGILCPRFSNFPQEKTTTLHIYIVSSVPSALS